MTKRTENLFVLFIFLQIIDENDGRKRPYKSLLLTRLAVTMEMNIL